MNPSSSSRHRTAQPLATLPHAAAVDRSRRRFGAALGAVGAATLGGWWSLAQAAPWRPERNVEFVVPAGPGGALDQVGRAVKQYYDESGTGPAGKAFLVTNKPGANGKIAFDTLKQHSGDPHFLSVNTHGYIASYLTSNLDTLPHRDLVTIAVLQDEFLVLGVRADSPIKNVQGLLAEMRRDPASQRIGVATSIGNHIHVGTAKALKAGGVDITKLVVAPFKSSSDSIVALVGGHIELVASTTPNVIAMLQAGKIRLLAVRSDKRLGGTFAGVPTWRESGIDGSFSSALGIVAPKGITAEQIAYWEGLCRQMVRGAERTTLVERNQSRSNFIPHAEAAAYYEREYQGMRGIVSELGLLKSTS
jgi:putative tricarboxylic transport membrane protein